MENGISGGHGAVAGQTAGFSETDFQRLAQTIATSIQKILQNGKYNQLGYHFELLCIKVSIKIAVSTMQRMVNQFNTPQDSPDLKKQL